MTISFARYATVAVLLATFGLAACGVNVHRDDVPPDTGLPVYPGAQVAHGRNGTPENADVHIGSPLFGGVNVVAATFEHDDAPQVIVDFYRDKLKAYGEVTECHGNVDFRRRSGVRRAVCKERPWTNEGEVQLVAGTEARHRIVVVKPRGSGSEFSVVYIQTDTQG